MAGMLNESPKVRFAPIPSGSVMKSETDLAQFYEQLSEEGCFMDLKGRQKRLEYRF